MSYKLKIKTLTPIHIGSGKTIGLFELKKFGNHIYRLNIDTCFRFVIDKSGNEALDKLNQWADQKSAEIDTYGQSKGQKDYQIDVFNFVDKFLKNRELTKELTNKIQNDNDFILYKINSIKEIKKTVSEIIKTAKNELYIPGSSIKGMLRTALATQYLFSNIDWKWLLDPLNKINNPENKKSRKEKIGDRDKNIDNQIQNEIFKCGCEVYENGQKKIKYSDEKYDLMKFVHITDTNSIPIEEAGCIIEPKLFLSSGKEQGQLNIYEAIKTGAEFEARISIDMDYLLSLKKNLPDIKDTKGNRIWINLEEKFKKLFGVELKNLTKNNLNDFESEMISNIQESLISLSTSELNKEAITPNNKLDPFYNELKEKSVKLGWASQFYSTTLFEVLANSTNEDFDKTPEVLNTVKETYLKILNTLKIAKKEIKDSVNFPVSRRYNPSGLSSLEALGWIEINFDK